MKDEYLINERTLWYLVGGIVFLAVANVIDLLAGQPFWGITRFIYLGFDNNVPAWYSSILLAVAGLLCYECSVQAKKLNLPAVSGGLPFLLFAALLVFMSCDEVASFHEHIGGYVAKFAGISSMDFAKHASWVWIGGPFIIVVFAGFLFFLKRALSLVSNSMLYLTLGISLIILGGIVLESTINFLNHEELQWVWESELVLEESLEMIGTVVIAYSLLLWRDGVTKNFSTQNYA